MLWKDASHIPCVTWLCRLGFKNQINAAGVLKSIQIQITINRNLSAEWGKVNR